MRSKILAAGVLMGMGACAAPAIALPVPITQITFAGSGSLPFTTPTLVVPDADTTVSAGRGLRRYDAHLAKMVELTQYWCQNRKPDFRVDWNYEAENGRVFMGQFPIACRTASNIFRKIGTANTERLTFQYRGNPRSENIPVLDLRGRRVGQFLDLAKSLKPQCIEGAAKRCPGDRLKRSSRPERTPERSVESSAAQCNRAVLRAKNRLEQVKNVQVDRMRRYSLREIYSDAPADRPFSYGFGIRGNGADAVMNSPKFLTALTREIVSGCSDVSAVSFNVSESDWMVRYGLLKNGNVGEFTCLDPEPGLRPKWGTLICL